MDEQPSQTPRRPQFRHPLQSLLPRDLDPALQSIRGAFQSALQLGLYRPIGYAGLHSSPACPLPLQRRHALCDGPAAIGYGADEWCRHSARFLMNDRGQRVFVQEWVPLKENDTLEEVKSWWKLLWKPWIWGNGAIHRRESRRSKSYKGIVFLVHGLNGHSGSYRDVAKGWVDAGYAVVAHDLHGHGRSDGMRAYAHSLQHYVEDARLCVNDMERRLGGGPGVHIPKFLLGHSLGGAIAIHLARDDPNGQCTWNGVLLTAPAVKVYPDPLLKMFAPLIATFAPMLPVQKLKFDRRRKRGRSDGKSDPLMVKSPVRARLGYEVLKSCEKIMNEADKFEVPSFVAHSRFDLVTNSRGSVAFHQRIASKDKTLELYSGDTHDLLEGRREIVMTDMIKWANQRLRRRPRCRTDNTPQQRRRQQSRLRPLPI